MQADLLSYTKPNLQLNYSHSDAILLLDERFPNFADNLIEFAGRVCYASTMRMNSTPHFIRARMQEEHMDIIEHVSATFSVKKCPGLWRLMMLNRFITLTELDNDDWIMSGNARVWYELIAHAQKLIADGEKAKAHVDLIWYMLAQDVLSAMRTIAPETFVLLGDGPKITLPDTPVISVPIYSGGVVLLGASAAVSQHVKHMYATFLISGADRAMSHQFVRHRLGSFSQESQRYVGLDKGKWEMIVPDSIAKNEAASALLQTQWEMIKYAYSALREMNILKEDARVILPNGCETRFVVTMPIPGWQHFLHLRLDKAAQLPIRNIARLVKAALEDLEII